ncbi:MAG: RNA polymerase sigma factor [Planctomycetes bacterium]|nr:RNA polymerase sigma factor [Planctomycetota bacterium]
MADDGVDDRLMQTLAAGDGDALREIFRRHGRALFGFIVRLIGNRAAAEDLTQEAFLRVYRNANRYVPGGGFRAWLYTIARHLAMNHVRDRSMEKTMTPVPEPVAPPPEPERSELRKAIDLAIGGVPEPFRSALVLCVVEGLSYEEAAEACGCSVKTLSSRLARGRERFRELMAPYLANGRLVRPESHR